MQDTLIKTERMVLRPLRPSDAGLVSLYAGDERVATMLEQVPHPYPPGAAEAFIRRATTPDRGEVIRALDATPSDGAELVGVVAAKEVGDGTERIGYWVGPPFWNTGLAHEAVTALIAERFRSGVPALTARVFQDNPGSAKVLTDLGFAYVGETEAYSVARRGMVESWAYRLDAER
ncbi:MAG: GNAT family N-acetyltransferase [Pseudomonadota bacterium]